MKKILSITMTAALLAVSGCKDYDDSKVWDELYNQSLRLEAIEAWQNTVNGNIGALQTIVAALQSYDYVTGVTPFTTPAPGGYTISFTKSPQVTITNGKDGAKGDKGDTGSAGANGNDGAAAPQIGVAQYPAESGVYYWTLGGDFLEDAGGNKIPVTGEKGDPGDEGGKGNDGADGKTPTVIIGGDGYWYICPSGACTGTPSSDGEGGWEKTGTKATGNNGAQGDPGHTPVIGVDEEGGILYWTVDGGWLKDTGGNKIPVTGEKGDEGNEGKTPTVIIGSDGNWYICPDGTCTGTPPAATGWEPTGVPATGNPGQPGDDGDTPKVIIGTDGYWYICTDGSCTGTPSSDGDGGWEKTTTKAKGDTGDPGNDGITPQLRINETSGEWETCVTGNCGKDDGDWIPTGRIAAPVISADEFEGVYYWKVNGEWLLDNDGNKIPLTGKKGDEGKEGKEGADGKTPKVAIGSDNYWYICPDGSCTGTPNTDGDGGWEKTGTKAIGTDGDKGEKGAQGDAIFAKDGINNDDPNYVEFTLAAGGTLKVPKYVQLSINFTPPTPFNNSEPKNISLELAGYVQTIVAVDVPRGWSIAFDLNTKGSEKMTVTAPAAGSGYYTAAGTATLLVSDGNTQTITASLALACNTPYTPPAAPDITFTPPGAFTLGEPQDITFTVQGEVKTILAVDVPRGWTVDLSLGGKKITVMPPAADAKYYTASGTVKLLVSDNAARTTIKPLTLSCPAYQAPEKLDISFTQPETFLKGEEKRVPFTTQGGATIIKVLDVPAGWTVAVTKQGNAGTFTVTAPAEETELLGALILVSDAAGNTVMRTLELRVPYTPADATVDFTEFAPCPEAAVGTVWYLTDTRAGGNNNTYKVKKLQDNRIWMVQDLKFGTCPNSTASWNNDNSEAATTAGTTVYTGYVGHCRSSSQANAGYLYNWPAAMQSTKAYKGSSDNSFQCTGTSGSACQGICPSGWHIPTGNTAGEFNILHSVSGRNCSTSNDDCWDSGSTFEGVIGGYCSDGGSLYGQGSYADYWSSTYSSNGDAYFQYFDSAYTGRGTDSNSKGNGRSVRCVRNY